MKKEIRFEVGSQPCSKCGKKKFVNQYNIKSKIKGLSVQKIYFFCKECAKESGLKFKDKAEEV